VRRHHLTHDCDGSEVRQRNYQAQKLVGAGGSPHNKLLKVAEVSGSGQALIAAVSLSSELPIPVPSIRAAQNFLNPLGDSPFSKQVFELTQLPSFFECLKNDDANGVYKLKTKEEVYNGVPVTTFFRYLIILGSMIDFFTTTVVARVYSLDGAHMHNIWGQYMLAIVGFGANHSVFPLAICLCSSENADNILFLVRKTQKYISTFGGSVIFTDQGSACTSQEVDDLFLQLDIFHRLCSGHLWKAICQNRQSKGKDSTNRIKGSLKGIENLLFDLGRSRSREYASTIMEKIRVKNETVFKYLEPLLPQVSAFGALERGRSSDGVITTQASEVFNKMMLEFRKRGVIEGIMMIIILIVIVR
jgi:hypothetical protein